MGWFQLETVNFRKGFRVVDHLTSPKSANDIARVLMYEELHSVLTSCTPLFAEERGPLPGAVFVAFVCTSKSELRRLECSLCSLELEGPRPRAVACYLEPTKATPQLHIAYELKGPLLYKRLETDKTIPAAPQQSFTGQFQQNTSAWKRNCCN